MTDPLKLRKGEPSTFVAPDAPEVADALDVAMTAFGERWAAQERAHAESIGRHGLSARYADPSS